MEDGGACGGRRRLWRTVAPVEDGGACGGRRRLWRKVASVEDGGACGGRRRLWRTEASVEDGGGGSAAHLQHTVASHLVNLVRLVILEPPPEVHPVDAGSGLAARFACQVARIARPVVHLEVVVGREARLDCGTRAANG